MPDLPSASSPLAPPTLPAPSRRGRLGWLVAAVFAAGSVTAFTVWIVLANTQLDAMKRVLDAPGTACATYAPAPAVVSLLAAGLGCAAAAAISSVLLRRGRGAGVAVTAVILLAVQALVFLLQYAPDGSEVSGGRFSATYCSVG